MGIHIILYFLRYLHFSNGRRAGHLSFGSRSRGAIFECNATTVLARFRYDSRAQDPKRKEIIIITINKQIKSKRENVMYDIMFYYTNDNTQYDY